MNKSSVLRCKYLLGAMSENDFFPTIQLGRFKYMPISETMVLVYIAKKLDSPFRFTQHFWNGQFNVFCTY